MISPCYAICFSFYEKNWWGCLHPGHDESQTKVPCLGKVSTSGATGHRQEQSCQGGNFFCRWKTPRVFFSCFILAAHTCISYIQIYIYICIYIYIHMYIYMIIVCVCGGGGRPKSKWCFSNLFLVFWGVEEPQFHHKRFGKSNSAMFRSRMSTEFWEKLTPMKVEKIPCRNVCARLKQRKRRALMLFSYLLSSAVEGVIMVNQIRVVGLSWNSPQDIPQTWQIDKS